MLGHRPERAGALPDMCTDAQGKMYESVFQQQQELEANVEKLITTDQERYIWNMIQQSAVEGAIEGTDEDA